MTIIRLFSQSKKNTTYSQAISQTISFIVYTITLLDDVMIWDRLALVSGAGQSAVRPFDRQVPFGSKFMRWFLQSIYTHDFIFQSFLRNFIIFIKMGPHGNENLGFQHFKSFWNQTFAIGS